MAYISARPLTILVVDDEPDIRMMLRVALKRDAAFGLVREAGGGLDAVALVAIDCPDAIVLDFRMPDLDGLEAARRIKDVCPDTKIILFSAYLSEKLFEDAAETGVDLCLPKTTTPNVVGEMIRNLCASG